MSISSVSVSCFQLTLGSLLCEQETEKAETRQPVRLVLDRLFWVFGFETYRITQWVEIRLMGQQQSFWTIPIKPNSDMWLSVSRLWRSRSKPRLRSGRRRCVHGSSSGLSEVRIENIHHPDCWGCCMTLWNSVLDAEGCDKNGWAEIRFIGAEYWIEESSMTIVQWCQTGPESTAKYGFRPGRPNPRCGFLKKKDWCGRTNRFGDAGGHPTQPNFGVVQSWAKIDVWNRLTRSGGLLCVQLLRRFTVIEREAHAQGNLRDVWC